MFMVTPFRGVGVIKVGGGLVGLILFVDFFPLVPQINFLDPIGHLVDRGILG